MNRWEEEYPNRNCLLKMNAGIIGIDIDHYDEWIENEKRWSRKRGYDHLALDISRYGELPPTYSSTSRGKLQPSRILFYRVDEGVEFNGAPYPDVEIIQNHHRYAVVKPSRHPRTEEQYEWYGPDGEICAAPRPADITTLPREWYAPLTSSTRTPKASRARTAPKGTRLPYAGGGEDWINALDVGPMTFPMTMLLAEFRERSNRHVGHDELLHWLGRLNHLWAVKGEGGAREVFDEIAQTYWDTTNDSNPILELSNAIRYVAGEGFKPCPKI
jgi:hypothetical protein